MQHVFKKILLQQKAKNLLLVSLAILLFLNISFIERSKLCHLQINLEIIFCECNLGNIVTVNHCFDLFQSCFLQLMPPSSVDLHILYTIMETLQRLVYFIQNYVLNILLLTCSACYTISYLLSQQTC